MKSVINRLDDALEPYLQEQYLDALAKLIDLGYPSGDQRLEAEAFWMELQAPATVISLFRSLCATGLRRP
jgi:hypothetical protein